MCEFQHSHLRTPILSLFLHPHTLTSPSETPPRRVPPGRPAPETLSPLARRTSAGQRCRPGAGWRRCSRARGTAGPRWRAGSACVREEEGGRRVGCGASVESKNNPLGHSLSLNSPNAGKAQRVVDIQRRHGRKLLWMERVEERSAKTKRASTHWCRVFLSPHTHPIEHEPSRLVDDVDGVQRGAGRHGEGGERETALSVCPTSKNENRFCFRFSFAFNKLHHENNQTPRNYL